MIARQPIPRLSLLDKDIERFHRDGFLIFEKFLDPERANSTLARFEAVFSGNFETGILPDKVKWLRGRDPDGIPRSQCNVWKADRKLASITLAEDIGRVASQLMGWNGVSCNQDFIMWIPPAAGTIAFHQDNPYHDWHEPQGILTCWIALGATSEIGGTLELARGSHQWPCTSRIERFLAPGDFRKELLEAASQVGAQVDLVPVVVPCGGAVFLNGNIWHGSGYNRSSEPRFSIGTHCMSSDTRFHPTLTNPMFNHYKRFGDLTMDESFFPILWTKDGRRSRFLQDYLKE